MPAEHSSDFFATNQPASRGRAEPAGFIGSDGGIDFSRAQQNPEAIKSEQYINKNGDERGNDARRRSDSVTTRAAPGRKSSGGATRDVRPQRINKEKRRPASMRGDTLKFPKIRRPARLRRRATVADAGTRGRGNGAIRPIDPPAEEPSGR